MENKKILKKKEGRKGKKKKKKRFNQKNCLNFALIQ